MSAATTGRPGAAPRLPSVDVVVPVRGDRGLLADTARALAAQDYPGALCVLLVDNGDNVDLAAALAPLPDALLLTGPATGSYAARNAALASSRADVLAFTDADCLPRPDWVRRGVEALRAQDAPSFVGGAIRVHPRDAAAPTGAELWDCLNGLQQAAYVEQGWAATANMLVTREVFDRVGPFDAGRFSGGDRDWGERASRLGITAHYASAAVVEHPARATLSELHRKIRRVTGGEQDMHRAAGTSLVRATLHASALRPNSRSILRRSRVLSEHWTGRRVRYVLVAHWVQYYFVLCRLRHDLSLEPGRE